MRYNELITESSVTIGDRTFPVTLNDRAKKLGDKLVYVDTQKFDKAWQPDEMYIGPGGAGGIRGRYPGFGDFLNTTQEAIEVSEVFVRANGEVSFANGRHRFAFMRDHGATKIPVAMCSEAIDNAKKYGYLV